MTEEIEQEIKETRIAFSQARKAFRQANPKRQVEPDAVKRFQTYTSEIINYFAEYVEDQMLTPHNSGKGCRIQTNHIIASYKTFKINLLEFMREEEKKMNTIRGLLKEEEE